MPRNLDLTALRSFVAVADTGGVTKAAGVLHLTQSAVSMQLKRLEESMGVVLFDRSARSISLSPNGEQLLGYARRMLSLNDEIYSRLTAQEFEGEVTLGVPHDIVYPVVPQILQRFAAEYPRVRVQLLTSFTRALKEQYARGEVDVLLTTEDEVGEGGETLAIKPLVWVGTEGGAAWRNRPLRLAFEKNCIFRQGVLRRLSEAGIPWEMVVETNSSRTVEATVTADLAVHALIEGTEPRHCERINHGGALPELRQTRINMYHREAEDSPIVGDLAQLIRTAYKLA
jgi:DNA-binding transcriptional LysR family regulator